MARYQNKPSLADLARRRGQSLFDVLKDWGLDPDADGFEDALAKRCHKEGVLPAKVVTGEKLVEMAKDAPKIDLPKNAVVEPLKKENASTVGKKLRKSKVTLDGLATGDEHERLDPRPSSGPEDPT